MCLVSLQVASLGRQLLQERTKVKALSEELESPLNVHRCVCFCVRAVGLCLCATATCDSQLDLASR